MLSTPSRLALFAIATSVLLSPTFGHAQNSLDIQGIDIAIGMERDVVLAKLKNFRMRCPGQESKQLGDCSSVLIQGDRPPYDPYGNVGFEKGKVKSILKYWDRGYEGTAPGKFVQTLYSVLSNQARQSAQFQVSVAERRDPGVVQQTIYFTSGRKTISITYAEGLRGVDGKTIPPFVNLNEFVE